MKQISVKLTDAENREFEDLAKRLGLSASDTIRFLINRGGREQSVIEKLDTILSHFESGGSVSNDHFLARLEGIEGRVESLFQALLKLIERLTPKQNPQGQPPSGQQNSVPSYAVWAAQQPQREGEALDQRRTRLQREFETKFGRKP